MSDTKPSFAIIGAGGVGGYFGACLLGAGYDVTFVARGAHLEAIKRDGLSVKGAGEPLRVDAKATDDVASIGTVDVVLLCVKLWDTETAAAACRPLLGPETVIASLQNGVDAEDVLVRTFGRECVLGGVAEVSASIGAPGRIDLHGNFHRIRLGELGGGRSARVERLCHHLEQPGIDVALEEDIETAIWRKFVFLTGLSALTAVTRRPIGDVRNDPDTRSLLQQVVEEAKAVGVARGIALPDDAAAKTLSQMDHLPPSIRASMAGDLAAGRRLELPWLSGAVVRLGAEHGVPTPANAFVVAALKLHAAGA